MSLGKQAGGLKEKEPSSVHLWGCVVCGADSMHEHHIVKRKLGGVETITLCPKHHAWADRGKISAELLWALLSERASGWELSDELGMCWELEYHRDVMMYSDVQFHDFYNEEYSHCLYPPSLDDARLLALWWNSTFHLIQLIGTRAEVGGSWVGWLKEDLLQMRVLNIKALSDDQKKQLREVYERWKSERFPSLLDQLKTHYPGRMAIDSAVAKCVGFRDSDESLTELYDAVADRIQWMLDLMGRQ